MASLIRIIGAAPVFEAIFEKMGLMWPHTIDQAAGSVDFHDERTHFFHLPSSHMKTLIFLAVVLVGQCFAADVAVIAPSVSTSMEARRVLAKLGWNEVSLKKAGGILVVVRSSLSYPLNPSYDSIQELKTDAEFQLNISGPKYHIYIFSITDDLEVREIKHIQYRADD